MLLILRLQNNCIFTHARRLKRIVAVMTTIHASVMMEDIKHDENAKEVCHSMGGHEEGNCE